jgi:hypothetical protein
MTLQYYGSDGCHCGRAIRWINTNWQMKLKTKYGRALKETMIQDLSLSKLEISNDQHRGERADEGDLREPFSNQKRWIELVTTPVIYQSPESKESERFSTCWDQEFNIVTRCNQLTYRRETRISDHFRTQNSRSIS